LAGTARGRGDARWRRPHPDGIPTPSTGWDSYPPGDSFQPGPHPPGPARRTDAHHRSVVSPWHALATGRGGVRNGDVRGGGVVGVCRFLGRIARGSSHAERFRARRRTGSRREFRSTPTTCQGRREGSRSALSGWPTVVTLFRAPRVHLSGFAGLHGVSVCGGQDHPA
jgi:hypothetical protein